MASFNQVTLIGNLTRDPQLRFIPSNNTPVVDFGLATNRKWKGPGGEEREDVTFVDCTAFAKPAEVINQYCRKGKQLFVQGRLRYDTWEDKQGGGKRSKLTVVVETFQFIGPREDGDGGGRHTDRAGENDQSRRGPSREEEPAAPSQFMGELKDDDIPFDRARRS